MNARSLGIRHCDLWTLDGVLVVAGCSLNVREFRAVALFNDGRTPQEIAERFGVSPAAIRMRIMRARRKCPRIVMHTTATGRFRCASQIGNAGDPLNLDSIN